MYDSQVCLGRALRQGTQDKINDFIKSLDESTTAMDQGINLNAAIVTVRVATKVDQLCKVAILLKINALRNV